MNRGIEAVLAKAGEGACLFDESTSVRRRSATRAGIGADRTGIADSGVDIAPVVRCRVGARVRTCACSATRVERRPGVERGRDDASPRSSRRRRGDEPAEIEARFVLGLMGERDRDAVVAERHRERLTGHREQARVARIVEQPRVVARRAAGGVVGVSLAVELERGIGGGILLEVREREACRSARGVAGVVVLRHVHPGQRRVAAHRDEDAPFVLRELNVGREGTDRDRVATVIRRVDRGGAGLAQREPPRLVVPTVGVVRVGDARIVRRVRAVGGGVVRERGTPRLERDERREPGVQTARVEDALPLVRVHPEHQRDGVVPDRVEVVRLDGATVELQVEVGVDRVENVSRRRDGEPDGVVKVVGRRVGAVPGGVASRVARAGDDDAERRARGRHVAKAGAKLAPGPRSACHAASLHCGGGA